MKKLLQMRHL